jgi:hypothetical protein
MVKVPVGDSLKMVVVAAAAVIIGAVALAFITQKGAVGLQGLSIIQSFSTLTSSVPNGISSLINNFFNWLGKFFTNSTLFMSGVTA